jgi:hypothetical protein
VACKQATEEDLETAGGPVGELSTCWFCSLCLPTLVALGGAIKVVWVPRREVISVLVSGRLLSAVVRLLLNPASLHIALSLLWHIIACSLIGTVVQTGPPLWPSSALRRRQCLTGTKIMYNLVNRFILPYVRQRGNMRRGMYPQDNFLTEMFAAVTL